MASMAASVGGSVITAFLKPVVEKASKEVTDQCCVTVNLKREMSGLLDTLLMIEGVLQRAEEKKANDDINSKRLRDLEDMCYEGRDILDEFVTVSAVTKIKAERASNTVKFNSLCSFLGQCLSICPLLTHAKVTLPLWLRYQLAKKIRSIKKRLEGMKNDMKNDMETAKLLASAIRGDHVSGANPAPVERHRQESDHRPEIGPALDKQSDLFVGREVQKESIMDKLLNYEDNHVHVIPITGMEGIGKTTLAQSVYNDDRVTEQMYPHKKWLCVGETKFNAKEIISKITNKSHAHDHGQAYQEQLKEELKGGRFLIVLDDVWIIHTNEWELFWNPLTEIGKGGIVIVTTREKKILTKIGIPVPDDLKTLGCEDSWTIFETRAFKNKNSSSDDHLVKLKSIGKEIVEKLNGLPLALRVVGGSLSNEHKVETWGNFLTYQEWMKTEQNDGIMSALRWSYNFLPLHLKKCFAYCSLFPKDHLFEEKTLVRMWMAQGFIDHNVRGEQKRPEDIGSEYFKQLADASLFEYFDLEEDDIVDFEEDDLGESYMMHDMIHDLAMLVSKDEIVRTKEEEELLTSEDIQKFRHISFHVGDNYWGNLKNCKATKRLLTFYSNYENIYEFYSAFTPKPSICRTIINDLFQQMKSLRVLVLMSKGITSIPDCISELIHLRYLDIEVTEVESIPDSLCDLYNLQTLKAPRNIVALPKNIVNLVNLRYITPGLFSCKGIRNMSSLQELNFIIICKGDDISELGYLTQLRGHLTIKGLENATCSQDSTQGIMQRMTYLEGLNLKFGEVLGTTDDDVQAEVLDALHCPPNLTDLRVDGYNGRRSPNWMSNGMYLAKLKILSLRKCPKLLELPPLGQLNSLEYLYLQEMDGITRLGEDFYGQGIDGKVFFPKLKELYLENMKNLKEWKSIVIEDDSSMTFFPCLTEFKISDCPELVSILPPVAINTSTNLSNVMGRSLSYLMLNDCHGLVVLEVGLFVSLKCLSISDCSKLTRITLNQCQESEKKEFVAKVFAVKELNIFGCNELLSFPSLVAIEELDVRNCKKLRSLSIGIQGWNSLQRLEVLDCPTVEAVFEEDSSSSPTTSSSSCSASSSTSISYSLPPSRLQKLVTDNQVVSSKLDEYSIFKEIRLRRMSETTSIAR